MQLPNTILEEQKEVLRNDLPRENFNLEQVNKSWEIFLNNLKKDNNIPSYNALTTVKLDIDLENNTEIIFEFSSHSSKQEFEKYKDLIKNNMRDQLNNHYFSFNLKYSDKESVNHILTKKEKFDYLSSKNPILLKLKEEFGLDLFD